MVVCNQENLDSSNSGGLGRNQVHGTAGCSETTRFGEDFLGKVAEDMGAFPRGSSLNRK